MGLQGDLKNSICIVMRAGKWQSPTSKWMAKHRSLSSDAELNSDCFLSRHSPTTTTVTPCLLAYWAEHILLCAYMTMGLI